ncbi:MAG: hypothetical protein ABI141_10825 [Gemmatimonadaceae bacterium]
MIGNLGGTLTVDRAQVGIPTPGTESSFTSGITLAPGDCYEIASDNGASGIGSNFTLTETPSSNLVVVIAENENGVSTKSGNGATFLVNSFHGYTVAFENRLHGHVH